MKKLIRFGTIARETKTQRRGNPAFDGGFIVTQGVTYPACQFNPAGTATATNLECTQ